jgi:hypothetical protein
MRVVGKMLLVLLKKSGDVCLVDELVQPGAVS